MAASSPSQNVTPGVSVTPAKIKFSEVPTVTVFVGKDRRSFLVHRTLLCEASSFFEAAFEGNFQEGSEQKMELPEEDEDVFDLFVQWLYDRSYEIPPGSHEDRLLGQVKLYVVAHRYNVGDLMNLMIEKAFQMSQRFKGGVPSSLRLGEALTYVCDHTTRGSGLRRLLADCYTWHVPSFWFQSTFSQKWLREHPEVALAIVYSFATTTSRTHQMSPFAGVMPEKYKDN